MKCWFGLILMFIMANANASMITVCPNGCEYSCIQTAINAAESGDIIQVQSGAYYENIDINKQITLRGIDTGMGKPVLDAGFNGNCFRLNEDGITIEGFAVTNSIGLIDKVPYSSGGIYVGSKNNKIKMNEIINNPVGIEIIESGNNIIEGNNISNNGNGIYIDSSINNTINQNIINGNYLCGGIIKDLGGAQQYCGIGNGIHLRYSSGNDITYNEIKNNCEGITLESSHLNTITHNEMTYNLGNIDLRDSINNVITPNRMTEYRSIRGSGIDFCEAGDMRRSGYKH